MWTQNCQSRVSAWPPPVPHSPQFALHPQGHGSSQGFLLGRGSSLCGMDWGGEAPLTVSPGQKGEMGPAFPLCGAWPGGGSLGQEPPGLCISSVSSQSGPSLPQFPAQSHRKARHGHWCQQEVGSRGRLCLLTQRSSFHSTNSRCGWCWGRETKRGAGGPSVAVQSGRACGSHRRDRTRESGPLRVGAGVGREGPGRGRGGGAAEGGMGPWLLCV